jgi:hypothetical protein
MRLSEALALRWRHGDFVDTVVHVQEELTRPKRGERARAVPRKSFRDPYQALLLPALARVLTERLESELAAGRGREDDFVLAMPRTGLPPHQRTLYDAVVDAASSAGDAEGPPWLLRLDRRAEHPRPR